MSGVNQCRRAAGGGDGVGAARRRRPWDRGRSRGELGGRSDDDVSLLAAILNERSGFGASRLGHIQKGSTPYGYFELRINCSTQRAYKLPGELFLLTGVRSAQGRDLRARSDSGEGGSAA